MKDNNQICITTLSLSKNSLSKSNFFKHVAFLKYKFSWEKKFENQISFLNVTFSL